MKKVIILTALLAASAVGARAEFYMGASLTTTASDIDTAVENFESDEMGWKAYAGWNILSFLGVEAGYRELGSFNGRNEDVSFNYDIKVIDASARAFLPIGKLFNLYAKAGYANIAWDGEIDLGEEIDNFNEDDWELFYGVGTEFNLGRNFAIRAEWEKYDAVEDLSTLSAGIIWRF